MIASRVNRWSVRLQAKRALCDSAIKIRVRLCEDELRRAPKPRAVNSLSLMTIASWSPPSHPEQDGRNDSAPMIVRFPCESRTSSNASLLHHIA